MLTTATSTRSNRAIFLHRDTGSPHNGLMTHISSLGRIARLDFERCAVAGEVIFAVESDVTPDSQQDEEARIGTLAYALKKLRNVEDAAEFTRCLNAICDDGDARCRQTSASHYFNEIASRGANVVLKEMAILAMQLEGLNAVAETLETDEPYALAETESTCTSRDESDDIQFFFRQEVDAIRRVISNRRKSACFVHDEYCEWVNDFEAGGASIEDLDDAFAHLDAMDQYDEGGAIIVMSSHERTVPCGHIDPEFTADDLPERARHLVAELRRSYANGEPMDEIWEDINAQLEVIFPVSVNLDFPQDYFPTNRITGQDKRVMILRRPRFTSHANRELQSFCREALETILDECQKDFHLAALRTNRMYRQFHKAIRGASDTRTVGDAMKQAFEARQAGTLSLKHFVALKTAATLQRERLESARLSLTASNLIKEIDAASEARLRYLSWAFYGNNQPNHPVHSLNSQEIHRVWEALKTRKASIPVSVFRKAA